MQCLINITTVIYVYLQIDDESIHAHKIVLAMTIPYFHAMFLNQMVENGKTEVTMKHFDVA